MRALLMVTRRRDRAYNIEAEPVLINTDDPDVVVLELDDGECLELDARELRLALEEAA